MDLEMRLETRGEVEDGDEAVFFNHEKHERHEKRFGRAVGLGQGGTPNL